MASSIRRSILSRFLLIVACLVAAPITWAQHGPARVVGGGVHVSPPPLPAAPLYHPPAYSTPAAVPRISAFAPRGVPSAGFRPSGRPIRPFPPVVIIVYPLLVGPPPLWQFNSCWWASCELFWNLSYVMVPYYQYSPPNYVMAPQYEAPMVYGEVSRDLPQLYLKDGSILSVTDYWVVDDRLHFKMIEADGARPVEHDIPFDQLDLQKTIDVNTRRGFTFMLRNEPFEQYVRDHPDTPPGDATPPHD
jgi:hypothetical protein